MVLAVVGAWQLSPLREWARGEDLLETLASTRTWPLAPLWSAGLLALLSMVFVPVTLLIVGAGAVFGPWMGFVVAWVGSVLGAVLGFAVGARLWRDALRWVDRCSDKSSSRSSATARPDASSVASSARSHSVSICIERFERLEEPTRAKALSTTITFEWTLRQSSPWSGKWG